MMFYHHFPVSLSDTYFNVWQKLHKLFKISNQKIVININITFKASSQYHIWFSLYIYMSMPLQYFHLQYKQTKTATCDVLKIIWLFHHCIRSKSDPNNSTKTDRLDTYSTHTVRLYSIIKHTGTHHVPSEIRMKGARKDKSVELLIERLLCRRISITVATGPGRRQR